MNDLTQSCQDDVQRKANSQKKLGVAELREAYCHRCRNVGCSQSLGIGDKFGLRISNQLERLSNPNLLDVNDPRYESIPDWRDAPPNFEWSPSVVQSQIQVKEPVAMAAPKQDDFTPIDGLDDLKSNVTVVKPVAPIQRMRPQAMPAKGNTRHPQNGVMLDGTSPSPPVDEWASNTTAPVTKVRRGARIQFTDDGQVVIKKG